MHPEANETVDEKEMECKTSPLNKKEKMIFLQIADTPDLVLKTMA